MMGPHHSQVHNYFSFLTLPPSKPPQPSEREGGSQSLDLQTPSRLGHNSYTGMRNGREAGVVAPAAPAGGGGTNTGVSFCRSPSGRKSRPGVLHSEVANRRVRFWRSRTPTPQPQAVGYPRVTTPAAGIPSSLPPTGLGRHQRPLGPSLVASALGSRPLPVPKRGGGAERGLCRVTFAPPGPRAPISARRAFSTCPPLSTVKLTGDKLAVTEAPETPTISTASTAGLTLGTASPPQLPINNLQGPLPEEATTMNPSLVSTGKTTQQQQQLLLQQQDLERGEALPPPDPLASGVRQGTSLLLDDTVDPLAADGVSLAATRAAAVAKAAAAVAAAAQAEVEAVAAVAAWGERGAYKGGNNSLAAEQRKEQLMLVLRLLLLLPPELQHAIQARLFMLQQRRSGSGAAHPWAKRAATTANLHMTFGASGTIGVPSRPQQQQHPAAAAGAAAPAASPRASRPNPNELPESSSSNSFTKTADSPQQQQEKQQQQHQHQHLQHSGADSTVNGLFLSATLQASAVLQLTPGGPLEERTILATPTPATAAEGGSASHLPASCRLASCRCRSSAASGLPYRAQPSFTHGRSSLLLQQQQHQQQQHVHLPRLQPQDYTGGGPLGSQQQHQDAQTHAEGGFPGRSSLGGPQASCCLLRRSVASQKGEALWMVETPGGLQGPPGPSSWVAGTCRRCAGAAAASSGSFCSSNCSRGGQAREQPSCLQQHGVAGGPRPHGGASQLHFYGSTSSHLSTTNRGRSPPASGTTECCHGLHKGPCSKGPPSAAHQQQQQVTKEEEKAGWASAEGGLGGRARQKLNWGKGSLSPSAVELRMSMGCRGQQQAPRQAVTVHPSQMVGLRMRPCSSCRNSSSSSMSCGNQGLVQVHLSSIPSIMRTDPMMGACSTAANLGTLPDSRSSRLLVVARSRSGAPMALALNPNRGSNSTVSSGTDSSNTATSNSLSDASRNKEAPLETLQLDGEEATLREREESLLPGGPGKTQLGAAAQAAVAATIAAANLGRRSWSQRAEAEKGCEQPLQILRSRVLECPPATPEREHCCPADCCSSPTLTVGRSSSRGDLDDPICDLDDRTGEIDDPLCDLDEPTGRLDEPMEDDVGDPTSDLGDCKNHLRPPACPWVIRSSPSIETLSASLASGFVPLPEAETISSGKSINGPTSIFSGSDPRGYGGSLVKSTVFSVETLPTTVVLPSRRGCPAALSLGGPQGLRNQQQNAPLSMLGMERCCSQSYSTFRLQDQQQHPSSCPNLPLRALSPAEKLLSSRVVCGMVSGSNEAPRLLQSRERAGNLWSHGCSQGTSCLPERSPVCLVPPKRGKPMRFAEEPLHCSSPPEAISTPDSSSPVATPRNTAFPRCLPSGRQGSQMQTSGGGWGRGLHGVTTQKGIFVGAHGGKILDAAGDLDMPSNCRRLPFVAQQSAAMPPTEEVAPVEDGKVGKAKAQGLEGFWVLLEKFRVPDGVDWRSSEIASAVNACISQLHSLHNSQCPPFNRELFLNALQAVPVECLAESRKAAAFIAALATSRKNGKRLSASRTKKGSQKVSAEDTETQLFPQPFQLFAFAGLDMEHAIPDGPSYVLNAAAEAQKDLALRHQRELDDLEASAARLKGDTSGVLALYADALQRVCHSALQRSLKASRAVALLQLADEERVHLLLRFQSELTRLCTETKTFQLRCSIDNNRANGSACERPPKQSTISLTVEPVSPEMSRAAASSKKIGGPSGLNLAEGGICLPSVPELLLLHDTGGVRKRLALLRPMGEAAREESWAEYNSLQLAPHVFEKQEQPVAALQLSRAFPSQVQLTGSALENFVSNKQIVSSFLNKFASWHFDATVNFKSEESFLRQLQEEYADVISSGVQVSLSKFVLQRREAAFRNLPREMASAEHIRELLDPVAKYFSECLPSPEVLLQQQVNTSIELLLGAPPAPLDVSKPCMPDHVAIWLEALMSCLSSRAGAPVCPHRLLPRGTPSTTGPPMNSQAQPTLAVPQVGNKDIWNENIKHVETELGLKLEQLRKECLNSLSEAAQTLESVMQVKVVRLPTAS